MIKSIVNGHVFNGETLLKNHAVIIDGDKVVQVLPQEQLPADIEVDFDLKGNYLVPGFIDLQVNGGGGVMFNNELSVEGLRTIAKAHRQYGTTGLLPTLITDSYDVMRQAIAAITQAIQEGVPGILGVHLEGPFLNPERKGAHAAEKFCVIDEQGFDIITSLKLGKTLITIAPELTTGPMIKRICDQGVVVSAGHTGADYEQTCEALEAGVTGFTHLYNAMTPLQSRAPGMVGAALNDEHSWFGIIADGFHMHPAAFRVAVAAKQQGGAILVTDAMSTVGASEKSFMLDGETIHAIDGRCTNAAGSLAGSDLDMNTAIKNAMKFARVDWMEAVRMATVYPAQAIGVEDQLGFIKPGFQASFVSLDANQNVTGTWIAGEK
ncbi:N-acetylglucosamine-6-phosphate deacetylase [uncultured Paraglaciecola sp.]|uniref:N-acetylglucosamine-6-phosphate deacetylase n=1 Tax=uncultured Paraglaciecola sp. TaxID=1765024 RepID=UPI0030DCF501|tara:strand:- start:35942 stop:37078 length:1137 start_codon:yes stop_codon:yes gene_type:complete